MCHLFTGRLMGARGALCHNKSKSVNQPFVLVFVSRTFRLFVFVATRLSLYNWFHHLLMFHTFSLFSSSIVLFCHSRSKTCFSFMNWAQVAVSSCLKEPTSITRWSSLLGWVCPLTIHNAWLPQSRYHTFKKLQYPAKQGCDLEPGLLGSIRIC